MRNFVKWWNSFILNPEWPACKYSTCTRIFIKKYFRKINRQSIYKKTFKRYPYDWQFFHLFRLILGILEIRHQIWKSYASFCSMRPRVTQWIEIIWVKDYPYKTSPLLPVFWTPYLPLFLSFTRLFRIKSKVIIWGYCQWNPFLNLKFE